jgi:RNA polymerase sigma-70 factor, ECF subfamily
MNKIDLQTDEEVVENICKGQVDLYSIIIERYQNKLIRYINLLIRNHDYAVDIVQESFVKAYINLQGFDTNRKFSSWIYQIAHNQTLNFIKKHKRQILVSDDIDFISEEDIESDFDKKENLQKLENCIEALDTKYSEPLILFYFEKKSYSEISDILRMPEGTVATRISRAKSLIKKLCQKK